MRKHFFLCSSDSRALSALLRETLGPALAVAGGYITNVISGQSGGELVLLFPAAAGAGVEGYPGQVIYDSTDGSAKKDNEVFRTEGTRLLNEAVYYPYAVLDRFGGYELVVPQYRQALADLLSSDRPLVGVLFSRSEAYAVGHALGLGERYEMLVDRLHDALLQDEDTLLYSVQDGDLSAASRLLRQWAQEYIYS